MIGFHRFLLFIAVAVFAVLLFPSVEIAAEPAAKLELRKGDRIAILGNTLADRMQHDGWFETLLQARFPNHELTFRDLGFSGDEVQGYTERPEFNHRLRSLHFGSGDDWLTRVQADVIFAFFGYNESFAGA